ncbi:unnamed protein product, partial [Prorocentrum cordatum]
CQRSHSSPCSSSKHQHRAHIFARMRFLFLITGDDRVHADVHSTIWSVLTCCRMCTGEWTRYLSVCLCFWHKGLRGRNLKRVLGQTLGLVPIPIRFSNIVVGDLPAASCGDFFVAIEVGECPVQITSIAEDANPKVVQFEETLIVRVRNSPAEFSIRFSATTEEKRKRTASNAIYSFLNFLCSDLLSASHKVWCTCKLHIRVQPGMHFPAATRHLFGITHHR